MEPTHALAAWWSLVDADRTALGVVVALVVVTALAFVGRRVLARRR